MRHASRPALERRHVSEFARFLVAGLINTAVGYATYLVLAGPLGYQAAYAMAYAVGIAVAFLLNSRFVFRTRMTPQKAAVYPLVYVAQYLIGAIALRILVGSFGLDHRWSAFVVIVASIPVSFVLNRIVLAKRARDEARGCR